jgi:23S rRNA (adenine2030-N6)-methyltransferase
VPQGSPRHAAVAGRVGAALNYRHAFHAGGPADVIKHAVLLRILVHLRNKPAAFRVIDTHAGAGLYDLRGPEATRSPEWRDGIDKLRQVAIEGAASTLLAPYLDAVGALNPGRELAIYPGSPALVRALLRSQDRLVACELEPNAAAALAHNFGRDRRVKAIAIDGWVALNAYVPPPERRGLVLVDPPFEAPNEFSRLALALEAAHRKWATGIFLIWYPLKRRQDSDDLARRLRRSAIPKVLRIEVDFKTEREPGHLAGCGLIAVNPPWGLAGEVEALLPFFAGIFRGGGRMDWIARA